MNFTTESTLEGRIELLEMTIAAQEIRIDKLEERLEYLCSDLEQQIDVALNR